MEDRVDWNRVNRGIPVPIFTVPLDSVMDRAKSPASFGMKLKYICIYKIT